MEARAAIGWAVYDMEVRTAIGRAVYDVEAHATIGRAIHDVKARTAIGQAVYDVEERSAISCARGRGLPTRPNPPIQAAIFNGTVGYARLVGRLLLLVPLASKL